MKSRNQKEANIYWLLAVKANTQNEEHPVWSALSFQLWIRWCTSNCRNVSIRIECFCLSRTSWFCSVANSVLIICSLSWMAGSLTPSSRSRCLSFSVEMVTLSTGAINSLLEIRGNMSFTACKASTHATRSSRDSPLKWTLFVPVNTENLFSSDLLSRIVET